MRIYQKKFPLYDHYNLLERLHDFLKPKTYIEIGLRQGKSFALARWSTISIGIDPAPDIQYPMPPGAKLFRMTSDAFFAAREMWVELDEATVDMAFINGKHLFEYTLRDFINLERYTTPDSTIFVHGCYPIDGTTASRERTTQIWTGDVWKLIICLRKYRPDLEITTIDVPPSGLGIIRNLDPDSTVLSQLLGDLYEEFIPLPYEHIAIDKADKLKRMENDWRKIQALISSGRKSKLFSFWTKIGLMRRQRSTSTINRAQPLLRNHRIPGTQPKALGVLLCYNDADILADSIEALLENKHDLIVWDHGSDDGTAELLDKYSAHFRERKFIPRSFDFYRLYEVMSSHLLRNYCSEYDWISWPDQDEILEGPARDRSYFDYIAEVVDSEFDWVQFRNFNFWFTSEDDPALLSPSRRIRHYCLFPDCAPRIRAWRASAMNIRHFNHNPPQGLKYPVEFNLRHYPMRSELLMMRRLCKDRGDIQQGGANYHYNNMKKNVETLFIPPGCLHFDDGKSELNPEVIFNWRSIYGNA